MVIEVNGICYEVDSFEGDCRAAWFVDEAPTEAEENCIIVIRQKQLWLQATKNIPC
jgi:hypothetical protein